MHAQGVPIAVISAWLGHADPAFTMRTYVHAQDDALTAVAEDFVASCVTVVSLTARSNTRAASS